MISSTQIDNANKYYQQWSDKFKCRMLEQYFEGEQWKLKRDRVSPNYNPYTCNLIYSTIRQKLAALLFQRPNFQLSAAPGNYQWNPEVAIRSTYIKQDVLNTTISNPNLNFAKHLKRAARDSFFRFGIIEVGYAADWRNPQKEPVIMQSDLNPKTTKDRVVDQNEVPINERIYVKRINPRRFRVGVSDATDLNDHNWVGYYDYYYTKDLRNAKGINWPSKVSPISFAGDNYSAGYINELTMDRPDFLQYAQDASISKVWRCWDLVSKKEFLYLDDGMQELWSDDFERLPLIDIRWDERIEGFYPIPPVFQWISPQDEINEAREQTRSFRRRFTRKFQYVLNTIEPEEVEKFQSGPDGSIIAVKQANAITPIQNPDMGAVPELALQNARDDFGIVSGSSAEARGQIADRETATQATITQQRASIIESAEQMDFSNFVCLIGREILCTAQERLTEGIWIKETSNEMALTDVQVDAPIYKWIAAQDLSDGYDYTIEIDVLNKTPQAQALAQQSFTSFLALLGQYPMIAMSPVLIREAAYRCGYRNEKVIHQMQQVALASMAAKAQQAALQKGMTFNQGVASAGQNAQSTLNAQMQVPSPNDIQNQITQQIQ